MADNLTAARPYAKAIFALAQQTNRFHEWANALQMLSLIAIEAQKYYVLKNPKFRKQQKIDLFFGPAHTMSTIINFPEAENLLRLLMMQRRLMVLPQISKVFQELLNEHENILDAKVVSAVQLNTDQRNKIVAALEKRYQKKITLSEQVDSNLLGGAIIYAGDKVHDGSILGKLTRIREMFIGTRGNYA